MSPTVQQFWALAEQSQLIDAKQFESLEAEFLADSNSTHAKSTRRFAEWLVKKRVLTSYQATVLLNGRPGPFHTDTSNHVSFPAA